jgi:hypothetical protein
MMALAPPRLSRRRAAGRGDIASARNKFTFAAPSPRSQHLLRRAVTASVAGSLGLLILRVSLLFIFFSLLFILFLGGGLPSVWSAAPL